MKHKKIDKKELEEKINLIFDNVNDAIYIHTLGNKDVRGKFLDVNKKATEMLGYSKEEFLKMNPSKIDDKERAKEILPKAEKEIKEKGKSIFEMIHVKKDGKKISVELSSKIIDLKGQKVILTVARDISERKEIEEKFKTVIENSSNMFYIHDTKHKLSYVSPQCREIFGYTPEQMMVKWTTFLTDNPINKKGYNLTVRALKTGKQQEKYLLEFRRKDKQKIICEVSEKPIKDGDGKIIGISGSLNDITEKIETEKKLKENQKRFEEVANQSDEVFWEINEKGLYTYVSNASKKVFGYKPEEIINKKYFYDFFYGETKKQGKEILKELLEKEIILKNYENKIISKDKKIKTLYTNGLPIKKEGKVIGYRGVDIDITEKNKIQDELSQKEEMYRKLISNMYSGVVIYKPSSDGTKFYFKDFNKKAEEIDGVKKEDLLNKEVRKVFPGAVKMGLIDNLKDVYKTGESKNITESEYVDEKTGKTFYRDNFIFKISTGDIVAIYDDVTDRVKSRKELEKKISELERLNKIMVGRELKMIELKKKLESKK